MDKLKRYECCNGRAKEVGGPRFFELFNGQLVCDVFDAKALEDENKRLKAENEKLKRIEQKAFWWSAEFTDICHDRKIQSSWEDWCENFRNLVQ